MSKLKIQSYQIIAEDEKEYLSFPDIIQSIHDTDKFFIVYRSADDHHPLFSYLHFLKSIDKGRTWKEETTWVSCMKSQGLVWNCPRLFYLNDGSLNIVCDTKNSRREREADFNIFVLKSTDDGNSWDVKKTQMKGMVPDKVIKFKNKLYCANHSVDTAYNSLTQLVNSSNDGGRTWYDCSIIARGGRSVKFCEASIINVENNYLQAYIRDNTYYLSRGKMVPQLVRKYMSVDGVKWEKNGELKNIYGHRMTCLYENGKMFASYRNTKDVGISLLTCDVDRSQEKNIEVIQIEDETDDNLFHCGYTGLVKNGNELMVVYYTKKDKPNPFIKLCRLIYD